MCCALTKLPRIEIISAAQSIRRLGGKQATASQLRPVEDIALEDAIATIETEILPQLTAAAQANRVTVAVSGAASALEDGQRCRPMWRLPLVLYSCCS